MLVRRTLLAALATGLLASSAGIAGATHQFTYEPTTTRFFMRNDGGTTCPGDPYLSTTAGANEPGCGYQGGAPVAELHYNGAPIAYTPKTYITRDGTPQYLDPSRDVSGNVRVVSTATTNRMAAGQIQVDVTLRARTQAGQNIVLGTHSSEVIVNPTNSAEVDFPFTIDLATHAGLDKVALSELTTVVDIRGWHVLSGYHRLNGASWFDLPAYIRTPIPH